MQITQLESNVVGRYLRENNTVLINETFLPYEETTLFGVLHEMYHAYQYPCIELYTNDSELLFFRQVEQCRKEFDGMKKILRQERVIYHIICRILKYQ